MLKLYLAKEDDEVVDTEDNDEIDENKTPLVDLIYKRNLLENEGKDAKVGFKLLDNEVDSRIDEYKNKDETSEDDNSFGDSTDDSYNSDNDGSGEESDTGSDDDSNNTDESDDNTDKPTSSDDDQESDNQEEKDVDEDAKVFDLSEDEEEADKKPTGESFSLSYEALNKMVNSEQVAFDQGMKQVGSGIKKGAGYLADGAVNNRLSQKVGGSIKNGAGYLADKMTQGAKSDLDLVGGGIAALARKSLKTSKKILHIGNETPLKFNKILAEIHKLENNIKLLDKNFDKVNYSNSKVLSKIFIDDNSDLRSILTDQLKLKEDLFKATLNKVAANSTQIGNLLNYVIKGNLKLTAESVYEDPQFNGFNKSDKHLYEHDTDLTEYEYFKLLPGHNALVGVFPSTSDDLNEYSKGLAKSKMMLLPTLKDKMVGEVTIKDINEIRNIVTLMKALCVSYINSQAFYKELDKHKKDISKGISLKYKMLNLLVRTKRDQIKQLSLLLEHKVEFYDKTFISASVAVQNNHYHFLNNSIVFIKGVLKTS